MNNFSFTPEWREEKNKLYVLATEGSIDAESINLVTTYRDISIEYNNAQIAYNYRASEENKNNLDTVRQQYLTARRALINFIKAKHLDFIDPDEEN